MPNRIALNLLFASVFLAPYASARDLCYTGTLEFNPYSIFKYVGPDKTEYHVDSDRTTNAKASYQLLLTLHPDAKTGELGLKNLGTDLSVPIVFTRDNNGKRVLDTLTRLPLSRVFPNRENVRLKQQCDKCMDATLVSADGSHEFSIQLSRGFDLNSSPRFGLSGLHAGHRGPDHDPMFLYDYEVRYCDDGTGYFEYELVACSKENGLCRVSNNKTKQQEVVQVPEAAVGALAQRLSPASGKIAYQTRGFTLNLESHIFNRGFVSEKALPAKAVEQLSAR